MPFKEIIATSVSIKLRGIVLETSVLAQLIIIKLRKVVITIFAIGVLPSLFKSFK